jgi:hypothetical protein
MWQRQCCLNHDDSSSSSSSEIMTTAVTSSNSYVAAVVCACCCATDALFLLLVHHCCTWFICIMHMIQSLQFNGYKYTIRQPKHNATTPQVDTKCVCVAAACIGHYARTAIVVSTPHTSTAKLLQELTAPKSWAKANRSREKKESSG